MLFSLHWFRNKFNNQNDINLKCVDYFRYAIHMGDY